MNYFVFVFFISTLSIVTGQQCPARFNELISGNCLPPNTCNGTLLTASKCEIRRCCIPSTFPTTPQVCITANQFDILYNTTRATYLRPVLNFGINSAGICQNCQAKAAFLAIAATMTDDFQTDEATETDSQLANDDNKYGNTQPGDGSRFRRRGFFGLRGRTMYARLDQSMPQYQSLNNPESVALIGNSIVIAAALWKNPNLLNESPLTPYADGTFYGFSILWYKLTGDIGKLSIAAKHYSTFLRQLGCGGDLYPGQGPVCQYNATHTGVCSPDCIKGLEDSSSFCGCVGGKGPQCPNSPSHVICCLGTCSQELKMDLGFVLDASGSVGISDYGLQQRFTKDVLRQANVGPNKTHVGIINYSSTFQILTLLNTDYSLAQKLTRVDQATYFGKGTNTALALQQANTVFSYAKGRRSTEEGVTPVIFVITDGASDNRAATIQAAQVLKQNGIIIVSVGVGNGPDLIELHSICTPPASENYFPMSNYNALEQKLNQFTSKSCSEPLPISSNSTVTIEISKDKYKFLKVEITTIGNKILITVTLFNGKVKLFYSFNNRNPKDPSDFIDYETKASDHDESLWSKMKSYIPHLRKSEKKGESNQVTLVIDKPNEDVDFAYIGIKGVEDDNQFEVKFDDCAHVVCKASNLGLMKLTMFILIVIGILLR